MNDKKIKKELTRAEEQVMQILWDIEKGFVKDIVEKFEDPKPAYNTVSTIIRILETKEMVGHVAYGKTHEYFPLIKKDDYKKYTLNSLLKNYFNNSVSQLVSFFNKEENISAKELDSLIKLIENKKQKRK